MKVQEILTESTGGGNWLTIIKKHHKGIKAAFDAAKRNPTQATLQKLKKLLMAHAIAEENTVYPTLEEHGISDTSLEHEQDGAKAEVKKLAANWKDPDIKKKIAKLEKGVLEHAIQHEEKDRFKRLFSKLDAEQTKKLTIAYKKRYKQQI